MRWPIIQASQILQQGGIIAYPTEAVWGIGCDPSNQEALQRILNIKRRDQAKGMLLVASCVEQIAFLLKGVDRSTVERMFQSWQGDTPTTWLIPHRGKVLPEIHGDHDTVAVRVSHHPTVQALCDQFGGPIVSTSANVSGHSAAMNIMQVHRHLGGLLDFVLAGPLGGHSKPSQIIDAASGRIIRN